MRILIEGENLSDYLAKCHEAFRTGLRSFFDARCFGQGYKNFDPAVRTFSEIFNRVFPDGNPDLCIVSFPTETDLVYGNFGYQGREAVNVAIATVLSDYWRINENYHTEFANAIEEKGINYVLSYFPQPLSIWQNTRVANRFIYLPPCFDPMIFNDWKMEKSYDVGFLAAGTTEYTDFYPERYQIHQKLIKKNIKYLWAQHPGWNRNNDEHPLVGKNFSRAINSCRIFITTAGKYKNAHAKYIEAMASKALLMAEEPIGAECLKLKDGINYVKVSVNDIEEKIDYYLNHPERCVEIAEAGYQTAMRFHTCYTRAFEFYEHITGVQE